VHLLATIPELDAGDDELREEFDITSRNQLGRVLPLQPSAALQ
jgi:hypothetical protein